MRPAFPGIGGLVNADQRGFLFLAVVRGRIRVAHDRHFLIALDKFRHLFGDDIGVFHIGDRDVGPHHLAHLAGVTAGRVDHHFADHITLAGLHFPVARHPLLDASDARVGHDFRAHLPRAFRHCITDASRVDMPVSGSPRTRPARRLC